MLPYRSWYFFTAIPLLFLLGCASSEDTAVVEPYNNIILRTNIGDNGEDVLVREIVFSSDWIAPKHFHNADLFIYVLDGEFEVTYTGEDSITYSEGSALEMKAGKTMEARNPSDTAPLKLAVFQVGSPDAPFVVPVD